MNMFSGITDCTQQRPDRPGASNGTNPMEDFKSQWMSQVENRILVNTRAMVEDNSRCLSEEVEQKIQEMHQGIMQSFQNGMATVEDEMRGLRNQLRAGLQQAEENRQQVHNELMDLSLKTTHGSQGFLPQSQPQPQQLFDDYRASVEERLAQLDQQLRILSEGRSPSKTSKATGFGGAAQNNGMAVPLPAPSSPHVSPIQTYSVHPKGDVASFGTDQIDMTSLYYVLNNFPSMKAEIDNLPTKLRTLHIAACLFSLRSFDLADSARMNTYKELVRREAELAKTHGGRWPKDI